MTRDALPQADGDPRETTDTNPPMMSREQDAAIRLLQRQVKALQDYIDNGLPSVVGATVGVNWPK